MILVTRPCFSPACRGESRRQLISCPDHPDQVDCSGTCREKLVDQDGKCSFCNDVNPLLPPEKIPFSMDKELRLQRSPTKKRVTGKKKSRNKSARTRDRDRPSRSGGEEKSGERTKKGRRRGRRGRPGRRPRRQDGGSGGGSGSAS